MSLFKQEFSRTKPLVLSLICLLAGCAIPPKEGDLAHIKPVTAYQTDGALKSGLAAWPSDHWWRVYGDAQLSELMEEGLLGANDMRIAAARLKLARAKTGMTKSSLLPFVNAQATAKQEHQSYNYLMDEAFVPKGWNDAGIASLNFNWEIDFWGKNRSALAAAKGEQQAAEAEAAAARLAISSGIAGTYAKIAALYASRDAAINALRVRKSTVKLIQSRFDQALENESALERVKSSEQSTRARLAAIDEEIGLARNQMAALLGKGPDRGQSIKRPKVRGGRYSGLPKNLPLDLIGRRPDVVAARLRAEAALSRIDEAKASFYPNVNLVAMIGKQSLGLDLLTRTNSTLGSVGPAVSLPILDGGRLRSSYRMARASHDLSVATYDQTLVQALKDVADAVVSKRQLRKRLYATQKSAEAARKAHDLVKQRYNGGLATYLEVLAAEDAMIGARSATAALRARSFALDVQMVRALGGGFRKMETNK
ncbi:efflux transporter, outer membrane factor (OMF) lipoprotein, NodT family [Cohaesibacter sp. ES.047]|uniref:efflux transporter outer membrane subunit n=1 Tax=Cohaesibacter sp. ES.047 TaxID=1798205 RepID=UPI000BB8ED6C|nr:efflux transporter outer membrane subunit [Cohaesibacter sp. ES.047]SNY92141.1 efflux transporter, outer membrane factor (OMF) lipoprotein, NodT family [Cohaesibacter sp. ES.047]